MTVAHIGVAVLGAAGLLIMWADFVARVIVDRRRRHRTERVTL